MENVITMVFLMVIHSALCNSYLLYTCFCCSGIGLSGKCNHNVIFDGHTSAVVIIIHMLLLLWDWITGKCDHNDTFDGHIFSILQ